jgi:C1A family cysteine protease
MTDVMDVGVLVDATAPIAIAPDLGVRPTAYPMGWLPDWPDFRDFTPEHEEVRPLLAAVGISKPAEQVARLPAAVDLRAYFSPVENQGALGSCTANAAAGVVEYFERRAFGNYLDASRLFVYKATRDLLGWTGDTGAFLRSTMGALAMFGVPPEKYWPYVVAKFDVEPSAFLYAAAANYQAQTYFRLDPPGTPPATLLARIKANVAAGLPSMYGFTVYSSIAQAAVGGGIPLPAAGEKVLGGHANVICGYDDAKVVKNQPSGPTTTGAFVTRNSWGTGWGQLGYGYLPYDYVLKGIASDFWVMTKAAYVDTGQFGL